MSQSQLDDQRRRDFLRALDAAPFEVTDWEARFIESFLRRPAAAFTDKQREKIDQMRRDYADQLKS